MTHAELQRLEEAPCGRVDIECRAWLNVDDREVQAGVSGCLCANADHGGGLRGLRNCQGRETGGAAASGSGFSEQDGLAGLVRWDLIPALQVGVYWVAALAMSKSRCVVRVSSHEAVQVAFPRIRSGALCAVQPRSS